MVLWRILNTCTFAVCNRVSEDQAALFGSSIAVICEGWSVQSLPRLLTVRESPGSTADGRQLRKFSLKSIFRCYQSSLIFSTLIAIDSWAEDVSFEIYNLRFSRVLLLSDWGCCLLEARSHCVRLRKRCLEVAAYRGLILVCNLFVSSVRRVL